MGKISANHPTSHLQPSSIGFIPHIRPKFALLFLKAWPAVVVPDFALTHEANPAVKKDASLAGATFGDGTSARWRLTTLASSQVGPNIDLIPESIKTSITLGHPPSPADCSFVCACCPFQVGAGLSAVLPECDLRGLCCIIPSPRHHRDLCSTQAPSPPATSPGLPIHKHPQVALYPLLLQPFRVT